MAGRLKTLKTSSGAQVEFHHNTQGASWVTVNGKSVLTLKPDYDANTQKIYHLTHHDGRQGARHAILRFGTRPVMVKTAEKDLFGRPKEKKQEVQTLHSIQWENEPEKTYRFALNTLNILNTAGKFYKWNPADANSQQEGDTKFSFVTIQGIKCFKHAFPNGRSAIYGENYDKRQRISSGIGGEIFFAEYMPSVRGNYSPNMRKLSKVLPSGALELIQQNWYDADGNIAKTFKKDEKGSYYFKNGKNSIVAHSGTDNGFLWEKTFDEQGRLTKFKNKEKQFLFNYLSGACAEFSVKLVSRI